MQTQTKPLTQVVCAVLYNRQGQFLMNSRPAGKVCAGQWEFPGGKVEPGENALSALIREVKEELDLTLQQAVPWVTFEQTLPHARVCLHFYRSWWVSGTAKPAEGQTLGLFDSKNWPEPQLPAVARIREFMQLPSHWIRFEGRAQELIEQEAALTQKGVGAVIVRGFSAQEIANVQEQLHLQVWVPADDQAQALQASDGIVVSDVSQLPGLPAKALAVPAQPQHWQAYEAAGAVLAYSQGIQVGSSAWHNLFQANPVPIYLSGLKLSNAELLRPHGAQGWIDTL